MQAVHLVTVFLCSGLVASIAVYFFVSISLYFCCKYFCVCISVCVHAVHSGAVSSQIFPCFGAVASISLTKSDSNFNVFLYLAMRHANVQFQISVSKDEN